MRPQNEAKIDVVCPECAKATTTSVYRAQRNMVLTCPSCGGAIRLDSDEVQCEADRAECEWRAEWGIGADPLVSEA